MGDSDEANCLHIGRPAARVDPAGCVRRHKQWGRGPARSDHVPHHDHGHVRIDTAFHDYQSHGLVKAGSQERAGQASGTAAAVDADFGTREGADVEPGLAQAGVGLAVYFDREQAVAAEGQDVAGQRVALGGIDLNEFESAGLEEFDGFYRQPGEIDQSGVTARTAIPPLIGTILSD